MSARTAKDDLPLPQAIEAERAALGWALQNAAAAKILTDTLRPSDYFHDRHGLIHTAIARLVAQERPITREIVAETLGPDMHIVGGGVYLFDLTEAVETSYGFKDHLATIKKKAGQRRIIAECKRTILQAMSNGNDPGDLTVDLWEQLHDLDGERQLRLPILVKLSDVQAEQVQWLWAGYFPIGKITNIIGDPGLGKSYLALDICARVSRGLDMPDGADGTRGTVIYLTAEDGLSDTVRPRVDLLGGDPEKVVVLKGVGWEDKWTSFNLDADLPMLEAAVLKTRPALVVIDPLSAYLGMTDSHRDADVRGRLAPLAAMAEAHRFAVLCVLHMNKSEQQKAIYRASGALAFVAAARANFGVAEDPDDTGEAFGRKRKLFVPLKINLGPFPPQLAYRIDADGLHWDDRPITDLDPNMLLAGERKTTEATDLADAIDFLRQVLDRGPVLVKEIEKEARQAMMSWATVRRARTELGVIAYKDGFQGPWLWKLKT